MKVVHFPHQALTSKSVEVKEFDEKLKNTVEQMISIMNENKGVGLAANQVNILQRIVVMNCKPEEGSEPLIFINPEIINLSEDNKLYKEGCLSFPSLFVDVNRPETVYVRWQSITGEFKEGSFKDLEAVCIQHEIDHLNGVNFIDRIGKTKRQMSLLKYSKNKR